MSIFNKLGKKIKEVTCLSVLISMVSNPLLSTFTASYSATIDNIADVDFKNTSNTSFTVHSNLQTTTVNTSQLSFTLIPTGVTSVEGAPRSTWFFPAKVKNIGSLNDTYKLTIEGLNPTDLDSLIYFDLNGNGVLDPTDTLITQTSNLIPNQEYNVIVSVKDKVGLPVGTTITPILKATSIQDSNLTSNLQFAVKIIPPLALTTKVTNPDQTATPFGIEYFPIVVQNVGANSDKYNVTVDPASLPAGVTAEIYADLNGDGILQPTETLMTQTPNLLPQGKYPVIVVIKDTVGLPSNTIFNPVFKAVSNTDNTIKSDVNLSVTVKVSSSSQATPVPTVIPTPTSKPLTPVLKIQKTGFPQGRVNIGDDLSYYIEINNIGQVKADNLYLHDKLPSGLIIQKDTLVASDNGIIEYSFDNINWVTSFNTCADSKSCIKYIRVRWSSISPSQTYTVYFKTQVDGFVDGPIQNIAWVDTNPEVDPKKILTADGGLEPIRVFSNETKNVIANEIYVIGTLYDKKGQPREGVIVDVYDENGNKVGEDITGKEGGFKIPVDHKANYQITYKIDQSNKMYKDIVNVDKIGANPVPVHISGKVKDSQTQEIIVDARIDLLDESGKLINTGKTDENGEYLFERDSSGEVLKPGKYLVRVSHANGYVTYVSIDIQADSGDVIIAEDLLIDPFGIVFDEFGGEDLRIANAEVRLVTDCNKPESVVRLDNLAGGEEQKNPLYTNKEGIYQFFLNKNQLTDKKYCLMATADGYYSRIFAVRFTPIQTQSVLKTSSLSKFTALENNNDNKPIILYPRKFMAEILDDRGVTKIIPNIESLPYKIPLKPIKSLDITKKVNKSSIELGEIVTYSVETENKLKYSLKDGYVTDKLPLGFKYVDGSLSVDGKFVDKFTANDELKIPLGEMPPNKRFKIIYQARTGIRTESGRSINRAFASAVSPTNSKVNEGPAEAAVMVKKDVFSNNGNIIGRVYLDNNGNGLLDDKDKGLENIAIYTSNGIRVLSDIKGKYSIQDIPNGDFILHLDKSSLPPDTYLPSDATKIIEENNKKIDAVATNDIVLDNLNSNIIYVTDGEFKVKILDSKNRLELIDEKGALIDLKSETATATTLGLIEGINNFVYKIYSGDQVVEQKKIAICYLPKQIIPSKANWIGDDDYIRRVYVTKSGLAKENFRLVKAVPIDIPQGSDNISGHLISVFAYPAKFAAKEVKPITYPDIKNHWSKDVVEYESGLGVIHGYPDGLFKPGRSITRAETTKLTLVALKSFDVKMTTNLGYMTQIPAKVTARVVDLNNQEIITFYQDKPRKDGTHLISWNGRDKNGKLLPPAVYKFEVSVKDKNNNTEYLSTNIELLKPIGNYEAPKVKSDYNDMDKHWSEPFVKVGSEEKLVKGYPDGSFRPDGIIPRYEMAVIAVNALNLDLSKAKTDLPFPDAKDIPEWARKYVYLANINDLLPKFPDGKFRPKRPISRAEIAIFVRNLVRQQKIQTLLKGTISKYFDKLVIEGKVFNAEKEKMFEIPSEKASTDSFNLAPYDNKQASKVYFDETFKEKSMFEHNKDGSGVLPLPEQEINIEDFDKIAENPNLESPAKFKSEVDMNETKDIKYLFEIPATSVVITTQDGLDSKLVVNDVVIDKKLIGKIDENTKTKIKTFTYYGIPLEEGKNTIKGFSIDSYGNEVGELLTKTVYVKGKPDKITVDYTKIPADGKTPQNITINVLDKEGNPVPEDTLVTIGLEAGIIKSPDADINTQGYQARVKDGRVTIAVIPTNTVQTVKVVAKANEIKGEGIVDFTTPLREPILVALAHGDSGYNAVSGKTTAEDEKGTPGFNYNLGASVFTQGTIFNDYLLTFAGDTSRKLNQLNGSNESLLMPNGANTDNRTYPLYGDSSQTTQIALSNSNIYFKLEKDKSSFMIGDFNTAPINNQSQSNNTPRLSNYSRVLNGSKLSIDLPKLTTIDTFASMSKQGHQDDVIRGAGVSGPYYVSNIPMVVGTERVTVEVWDKTTFEFNNASLDATKAKVVGTPLTMNRFTDYDIDYTTGIITFRQAVPSFDDKLNPYIIRVSYEHDNINMNSNVIGATLNQQLPFGLSIGGTYITENTDVSGFMRNFIKDSVSTTNKPYQLIGANISERLDNGLIDFMAEYANSYYESKYGSAYRLSLLSKPFDGVALQGEYQLADNNFSNRAGGSVASGLERYIGRIDLKPTEKTTVTLDYSREKSFANNQIIQTAKLASTQDLFLNMFTESVESRFFPDPKETTKTKMSALLGLGYKPPTFYNFSLSLNREQNILMDSDPTKPTTTTFGLDYALANGIKPYVKLNLLEKNTLATAWVFGIDTSFVNSDWALFNNVNLGTKYQIDGAIDGRAAQNLLGLNTKVNLTPDIGVGANYERVTIDKTAPVKTDDDHNSLSLSLEYLPKDLGLKSSVKYDMRDGQRSSNMLSFNSAGAIGDDFGLFGRLSFSNTEDKTKPTSSDGLLGLAYRPLTSDFFNGLLKYEIKNKNEGIDLPSSMLNHIFSFEGFFQPSLDWEVFTKLSIKQLWDKTKDQNAQTGNIILGLTRVTYKFLYNFDVSGEFRHLRQQETNTAYNGITAELGYYPVKDLRLGVGYNFLSYFDNFSQDLDINKNYTAQGPYIILTVKVGRLGNLWGQNGEITKKDLLEKNNK